MSKPNDFGDLPEAFAIRNPDNTILQITKPCYSLLAPGFYGAHNQGTFYDEGEIIQTDQTPNYHMQPLNKAAARKMSDWLDSLPTAGVSINIDDLAEAAVMIANNPELAKMSKDEISQATQKIAVALKKKRDGTSGMVLPPMAGPSIHTVGQGQKAPPMGATRYLDPELRGPGQTGSRGVIHEPKLGEMATSRASQMSAAGTR